MCRFLISLAVSVSMLLHSIPAYAQAPTVGGVTYGATFGTVMTPSMVRAWYGSAERSAGRAMVVNIANGAVKVSRVMPVVVAGQVAVDVVGSRTLTSVALGRAAARFLPLVGTGMLLKDIADGIGCRAKGTPAFDGLIECDPGVTPQGGTVQVPEYTFHEGCCGWSPSPEAAKASINGYWASTAPNGWCGTKTISSDALGPSSIRGFQTGTVNGVAGCGSESQWNNPYGGELSRITRVVTQQGSSCSGGATMRADGKCTTGVYEPTEAVIVGEKIRNSPPFVADPSAVVKEMLDSPQFPSAQHIPEGEDAPVEVSGPSTVSGTPTTSSGPSGTTSSSPTWPMSYTGDKFSWGNPTTVTTGPGGTVTTTAPPEIKTCGLPGTPACKIDESGTPNGASATAAAAAAVAGAKQEQVAAVGSVVQPSGLGWAFGIDLPSGTCYALTVTTNRFGTSTWFNPCGNPNVELMRSLLGWIVGIMGALYIWRRVNETVEGL